MRPRSRPHSSRGVWNVALGCMYGVSLALLVYPSILALYICIPAVFSPLQLCIVWWVSVSVFCEGVVIFFVLRTTIKFLPYTLRHTQSACALCACGYDTVALRPTCSMLGPRLLRLVFFLLRGVVHMSRS